MFTLAEVASFYLSASARCEPELSAVVLTVVERAEVLARSYIGHQQEDWAPLSSATTQGFRHERGFWITGKEDLGYAGPDFEPLHRSGDTEDSIGCEADGLAGIVGSDSKVALYQEMGTPAARYPVPPRPVFAKAIIEAAMGFEELAEEVFESLLMPKV